MRTLRRVRTLAPCLLFLLAAAAGARALERGAEFDPAAIDAAIAQLGNDDFGVREAATTALKSMGDGIASQLTVALTQAPDAETKSRIQKILTSWPVGKIVWEFEAGFLFYHPVVADSHVYVGNKDMNFFCLDANTGKELWKSPIEGLMHASPVLSLDGSRVVVIRTLKDGRADGTLICLSTKDGSQLWTYHGEDSQFFSAPVIADGRLFVATEERMLCLDMATGTKVWERSAPQAIVTQPTVAGKRVVFGCLDDKLYCVSAEEGAPVWNFETRDAIPHAGAAIVGDRVFAGSNDNNIYCLDFKTGGRMWSFSGDGRIAGAPACADGKLFAGTDNGTFYCLKQDSGEVLWKIATEGTIFASASVTRDAVYVVSINNKLTLRCLNPDDGKQRWTFTTQEAGYATPVLWQRRVFVGYHSKFYCLRTAQPGPASWPMTGGNAARTNGND